MVFGLVAGGQQFGGALAHLDLEIDFLLEVEFLGEEKDIQDRKCFYVYLPNSNDGQLVNDPTYEICRLRRRRRRCPSLCEYRSK